MGARCRDSPGQGGLSDGGHDHIHRELLSAAGGDLHRHGVGQDETRPYQEVMAAPEHTWKGEREEGVSAPPQA